MASKRRGRWSRKREREVDRAFARYAERKRSNTGDDQRQKKTMA